jgi:RHS repeat-associated protein
VLLFAAVLLAASSAPAQVATGLPPFGSFSGGPDVVNNANLNVHLSVPVLNKAGRGMPFTYSLTYDSSIWYPSSASGTNTWTPLSGWGWMYITSAAVGEVTYKWSQGICTDRIGDVYLYDVYSNWIYYDPLNAPHAGPFSLRVSDWNTLAPNCTGKGPAYSAQSTVGDGSGYTLSVTAGPSATTYSRSGQTIVVPENTTTGSASITDPNNNQITATYFSPTTTLADTLGTTALTVSAPGGGSPTTYTYTGPDGNPHTFTVKYTSQTVRTNFGCSGITEFGATQEYLVSSIGLPDGTSYSFTYEVTPGDTHNPHYVTGRPASVTLPTGGTISYSYSGGSNGITCADGTAATLTRTTPDGAWTYAHSESGSGWTTTLTDPQSNQTTFNFQGIYETERQVGNLKAIYTCYNGASFPCNSTSITLPITQRTVTTSIGGLESEVNTDYNSHGLPTEVDQYAFGSGAVGGFVRKTLTTYNTSLNGIYIYDRPSQIQIVDSGGTARGQTAYSYDSYGNLTQETRYTGGTPSTISRTLTYGSYGVLTSATDFNSNPTSYSNFACNGAFPQTITSGGLTASLRWNCNGGVLTSTTDPNGAKTSYSYDTTDNIWRLAGTSFPDGGGTTIDYTSSTVRDVYTNVFGSTQRHDQLDLDGLGRLETTSLVNDPDGQTYVNTSYDSNGRLLTVGNPYRTTSSGGDTYAYDGLNRVTKITHADSTYLQISYGGSASQSCSPSTYGYGYPALYTDESGNQRQVFTDALGRLIEADEPNSSGSLTVSTCYTYDVLNNLYQLIQGSETRTFPHDMLSRLTSSTTPEAGTVSLYYATSAGSLCSGEPHAVCHRTDARGITTTYSYDALNRLSGKSYSNNNPTATAYTYDQTSCLGLSACYNKGRRTTMTDASGSTEWAYDAMGRILIEQRTIGSVTKNIAYTYNLDGSVATLTYPSGRTITYTVSAAQRPLSAVDTGDSINYVLSATYAPQGAVAGALLGESGSFGGITYAATYTNRLLPYTATATSSGGNALNLTFAYYANGNVETITNNLNTARTQTFTYDNLNRVATAQSQAASGTYCWGQSFGYDRYANLLSATVTQCTAPMLSLNVNANNQVTNSGFTYDASGDLTSDGTYTYTWDARHRLQSAGGVTYTYDGDGKRVMKSSGTLYWNRPHGRPLAETDASGNTLNEYIFFGGRRIARRDSSGNVYYYFSDHLGTTKTLATSAGVVCYDADFLPFGYEMAYTTTCAQNYKFTGLERDSETGLDQTLHRKYDPTLGRWLSADPKRGKVGNPQSLNRYPYVRDNPVAFVDRLGLTSCPASSITRTGGISAQDVCVDDGGGGGGDGGSGDDGSGDDGSGDGADGGSGGGGGAGADGGGGAGGGGGGDDSGSSSDDNANLPCYNGSGQQIACSDIGPPYAITVTTNPDFDQSLADVGTLAAGLDALTTPLVNAAVSGGLLVTGAAVVGIGVGSTAYVCGQTALLGCVAFATFGGAPTVGGGLALIYTGWEYTQQVTVPSIVNLF